MTWAKFRSPLDGVVEGNARCKLRAHVDEEPELPDTARLVNAIA
jgi:hypothetical protein